MKRTTTILETLTDAKLLGRHFAKSRLLGDTWQPWKVYAACLFGLPLDAKGLALYRDCTGRTSPPSGAFSESFVASGRRGGKTKFMSAVGVHLATLVDWSGVLSSGETGIGLLLAADRDQAQSLFRYIAAFLAESPILSRLVKSQLRESIVLSNGITIEVGTCDHRAIRGRSLIFCLADELAFWNAQGETNDVEVLRAVRPALAMTGGPLIAISSPYSKKGELFNSFRDNFGRDDSPVLCWRAATRVMNPRFNPLTVQAALLRDKAAARTEYMAEWREDIADFLSQDVIDECTVAGRKELPPQSGFSYVAFTDPAGGSGSDSFTCAVAHLEDGFIVLDAVREAPPPFSPEQTVEEFCRFLRTYRVSEVWGDAYGGGWPREAFSKHGVTYRTSDLVRSAIYLECLAWLNSRRAMLLDHERLRHQLAGLERRVSRSGKDTVDHGPNGHDDVSNAVCGALRLAAAYGNGEHGYIEFLKSLARGEHPELLLDPMQKYNAVPQAKPDEPVTLLASRACKCGAQLRQFSSDRSMWSCEACGARILQNPDFEIDRGPTREAKLAELADKISRSFGRFGGGRR